MQPFSDSRRTNPIRPRQRLQAIVIATGPSFRVSPQGRSSNSSTEVQKIKNKNTGDLQWEKRANYKARPCAGGGKIADARTMVSMEKQCEEQWKQAKNQGRDYVRL
jgi:hypothetical protein